MSNDFLYSKFCGEISQAINNNDIKQIFYLINCDTYAAISLEHKELQTFTSAYVGHHKDLINYLIFDYKINEKEPLELITTMNEISINLLNLNKFKLEVLKMFEIRDLAEEIKNELGSNAKNDTKLKV